MTNVIPFQPKAPMHNAHANAADESTVEAPRAFSFDIVQTGQKGLVLIDACVPLDMALKFMGMIGLNSEPAFT
jgi:hypothetical protein